jgi:poly-gamma-glutamate capsule biosynthesis protein CapA/YwtB (metallophosphatase superfamily)
VKRFLLVLLSLFVAFAVFSFLARTEPYSRRGPAVFIDREMAGRELVSKDIGARFPAAGVFDARSIHSYILANPDALFVTDKEIHSELYALKRTDYCFAPVAVTSRDSPLDSLEGARFDSLLLSQKGTYGEIVKRVAKGTLPIGVIPVETLNLELKPLRVDGIFPTFNNIKSRSYPKAIRANVYARENGRFSSREDILRRLRDTLDLKSPGEKSSFSIIAGGDVMLARGAGVAVDSHGPDYPFREIKRELDRHDIACANLECPISARGTKFTPDKGIYFKADPEVLQGIRWSGFDFLSLANNHSLDWGPEALADTMNGLKRAGIRYAGAGTSVDEALEPAVFTVGDTSVAFIACNDVYPLACSESGKTAMTLSLEYEALGARIGKLKERYDILIASVHAGREYDRKQEKTKVQAFRLLADLGVDVVLGHHPHVVQDVEIYKGRVIAYSLGNLVFDQSWSPETSEGLLLEVGFTGKRAVYVNLIPVSIQKTQARLVETKDGIPERELL